eukprot:3553183-Amphidinium_carterae.1
MSKQYYYLEPLNCDTSSRCTCYKSVSFTFGMTFFCPYQGHAAQCYGSGRIASAPMTRSSIQAKQNLHHYKSFAPPPQRSEAFVPHLRSDACVQSVNGMGLGSIRSSPTGGKSKREEHRYRSLL